MFCWFCPRFLPHAGLVSIRWPAIVSLLLSASSTAFDSPGSCLCSFGNIPGNTRSLPLSRQHHLPFGTRPHLHLLYHLRHLIYICNYIILLSFVQLFALYAINVITVTVIRISVTATQ